MGDDRDTGASAATPGPAKGSTSASTPYRPTSEETLSSRVVSRYLTEIAGDETVPLEVIRDTLLSRINSEFSLENKGRKDAYSTSPQLFKKRTLSEDVVVQVLLARARIVAVSLSGKSSADDTVLAMYVDMGPDAGLHVVSEAPIARLASELKPSMTASNIESLLKRVKIHAQVVTKTLDAHLVPVANGVYDTEAQELLDFSPDMVFLVKYPVEFDATAQNPVLVNPDDNSSWDVESWITTLSDDAGVPELLWELISATLRPGVRWNKAAFLHSTKGNNGKGTFCALLRELVGPDGHTSIPIANFGRNFALSELIHARAIIVDENSVGAFAKDLGDFKAVVTGDAFTLERKYKDPVSVRFSGMVVQCVNDFPKSRDKSASYTRRQLFIPFKKWFGGDERKYIKDDYLRREDVLKYVLRRALQMQHTTLSEPEACLELLAQFQRENNPVRDFWMEFEDQFVWDLLPTAFLFDLFVEWYRKTHPSGSPINRNDFASLLTDVLSGNDGWIYADTQKKHRPGQKMMAPELLIDAYELKDWIPTTYTGSDPVKRSTLSSFKSNYIGVLRAPVVAAPQVQLSSDDDSDDAGSSSSSVTTEERA